MKRRNGILYLVVAALLAAVIVFLRRVILVEYEEPKYELVTQEGDFELRRYASYIAADLEVTSDFENAASSAFESLAGYIFGANLTNEAIGMTSAVTQQQRGEKIGMTSPVTQQQSSGGRHTISFVMPSRYTMDTIPRPRDSRISLRTVPPSLMAVCRYRGNWSTKRYQEQEKRLLHFVASRRLVLQSSPVWARYDAPFWPPVPFRRNEILVAVTEP